MQQQKAIRILMEIARKAFIAKAGARPPAKKILDEIINVHIPELDKLLKGGK